MNASVMPVVERVKKQMEEAMNGKGFKLMPVIDVVVLPRGRLVEGDARVVLGLRGDDEAGDGLLEGGVEGLVVVGHEGGLRVV
jgi:hypothetical protein